MSPFAALVSALRRRLRQRIAREVSITRSADAFAALTLREFEIVVAEAFRAQGFDVRESHPMELRQRGDLFLADCSHWQAAKVPVAVVRELYSEMEARGAAGAYLITSGSFTEDAKVFVQDTHIRLVDGRELFELVRRDSVFAAA